MSIKRISLDQFASEYPGALTRVELEKGTMRVGGAAHSGGALAAVRRTAVDLRQHGDTGMRISGALAGPNG